MKKLALIMLAVVSMALVSCGGGDGKSKSESESKIPVVEMADPPFTFKKASDGDENVPLKGCFEVKRVTVADAGFNREEGFFMVKVSVTLEALQNVECGSLGGYCHVFDENMGDLTHSRGYKGRFYESDVSLEKGDVMVVTNNVCLQQGEYSDVKYVQIQDMMGYNSK